MDIGFRARAAQTVSVSALDLDLHLEAGEWLRIEVSSKFRRERDRVGARRGRPATRRLVDGCVRRLRGRYGPAP